MAQIKQSIDWDTKVKEVFGKSTSAEIPLSQGGAGVRFNGIDLCDPLTRKEADFFLKALAYRRIVCISGQDLSRFSLDHFERFSNHWGAPVPHPNNFMRGGKPAQSDGDSDGPFELIPFKNRSVSKANETFPDKLRCLLHESPAVLVVSNFNGPVNERECERVDEGGSWHTDIEYEPLPIYVSMFLAHKVPSNRNDEGSWVNKLEREDTGLGPYFEGSDSDLMKLRLRLPLNGETAFADTAAAFATFSEKKQQMLAGLQVRRRLNAGDEGWLAPLVRVNPISGLSSLHSPIWASRPRVRPAVEIEGMSSSESRVFLDSLEKHILQPQFRYDHEHVEGDVTIWDNYMTLHNSPPIKHDIKSIGDARLLYRLSCKGNPSLALPRKDDPDWLKKHIPGEYITPSDILNS